jgi:hypothetical protein
MFVPNPFARTIMFGFLRLFTGALAALLRLGTSSKDTERRREWYREMGP